MTINENEELPASPTLATPLAIDLCTACPRKFYANLGSISLLVGYEKSIECYICKYDVKHTAQHQYLIFCDSFSNVLQKSDLMH